MPKRPTKASASSTRAFGSGFGSSLGQSGFSSNASSLSYFWEPPDLSSISDPNLVVAFKNLTKKDSTTKAKGLEEIQSYVTSSKEIEDAVLESWVQYYPRLSIDSDRRVRQLAHSVQGRISVACGKRIAKHMPQVVGAWLAGTFDNDRGAAKAASDALRQLFTSPEKLQGVRKAYQGQILGFCKTAIDDETPESLSDERSSSPDDIASKYNRLIASVILLVTNLLQELEVEDVQKQEPVYAELLQDESLWKLSYHGDTQVRRAVHRLLKGCIVRHRELLGSAMPAIGAAYIGHGLRSDQTGTSLDFLEALTAIVGFDASIWSNNAKGAKSISRLCSLLKRGSQLGPSDYWVNVVSLLRQLPPETYANSLQDARELLNAMTAGIRRKDEPRTNLPTAWRAYVHVVELLLDDLTFEDGNSLITDHVLPILWQYVRPAAEASDWDLPKQAASSIVEQLLLNASIRGAVADEWPDSTLKLVQNMQTSLPEQAKDFRSSQDDVAKQGERWVSVHSSLLKHADQESKEMQALHKATDDTIRSALQLLQSRNGKPYGAAATISKAIYAFDLTPSAESELEAFTKQNLTSLFCSPSAQYFADVLYFFFDRDWFKDVWEATLRNVLEDQPALLHALLSSSHTPPDFELAITSPSLRSYIDDRTQQALTGRSDWSFLDGLTHTSSKGFDEAVVNDTLLSKLAESLSLDAEVPQALDGLHTLVKTNRKAVERYLQKPESSRLLPRLLFLSESADEDIAHSAINLNSLVQHGFTRNKDSTASLDTLSKTIRAGLLEASETSVSIEALNKLAFDFIDQQGTSAGPDVVVQLLPSTQDWQTAISPYLSLSPLPSLSITSPLSGALKMVRPAPASRGAVLGLPRDTEGQSCALRIIRYSTVLLQPLSLSSLPAESRVEYARLLCLSLTLANDNLSVAGANHLWSQYSPEIDTDMASLVSKMQSLIQSWVQASKEQGSSVGSHDFLKETIQALWAGSEGITPSSRIHAEAYATLMAELSESQGPRPSEAEDLSKQAADLRKRGELLQLAALLHGRATTIAPTAVGSRWCSELVAELTAADLVATGDESLVKLVLLNLLFANLPEAAKGIAKQRTVFFMRHLVQCLQMPRSHTLKAEIYHALAHVLPNVGDLYGQHWSQILAEITDSWTNAHPLSAAHPEQHGDLVLIYHALRLHTCLLSLAQSSDGDDANEDLVDALKDSQQSVADGLFHLLTLSRNCPDEYNQPLRTINGLVARRVRDLQPGLYPDLESIYPLLSAPSEVVQEVAYAALHSLIPAQQEQISLDAALEKRNVKLPEELLSLIVEAPTAQQLEDAPWERSIPLPLKGFLLSWLLVFDHFGSASYKVKSDYLDSLKEVSPLPPLLDFIFDFLGHGRGKPIDASRFDITTYDGSISSGDPKKDCQQLLAHVYFLALQYVPSLVKSWWIDLRARALVSSIETWTEKYVSPHIISAVLASVQQWAAEQSDPSNPNAAPSNELLKIAISHRANEIRASYDIDEQTLSITIRLPGAWPLLQAVVTGTSRVGVSEAKWQSWVRGCQGVIKFSNNNLIDGLVAFRRNVAGAMKGQTECAICYSVISSDKQLPSKRCGTCKNLFHSGCLYRWFKTSNASTCPLCRNPFNYG